MHEKHYNIADQLAKLTVVRCPIGQQELWADAGELTLHLKADPLVAITEGKDLRKDKYVVPDAQ